jgi:hypothetical protein
MYDVVHALELVGAVERVSHKLYAWLGLGVAGLEGHMARLRSSTSAETRRLLASKAELASHGRAKSQVAMAGAAARPGRGKEIGSPPRRTTRKTCLVQVAAGMLVHCLEAERAAGAGATVVGLHEIAERIVEGPNLIGRAAVPSEAARVSQGPAARSTEERARAIKDVERRLYDAMSILSAVGVVEKGPKRGQVRFRARSLTALELRTQWEAHDEQRRQKAAEKSSA